MAGPVTDAHRIMFRENITLALQESKDQFSDSFTYIGGVSGKQMQVTDIIGTIEARRNAPEGGDTPDLEGTHEPVWVRPERVDAGKLLKVEDAIKALTDFKSPYIQSMVNGVVRVKNIILAGALFGPRLIGNEVPVSTPWAGDTVPADLEQQGTSSRMSVRKILNGLRLFEDADVDPEMERITIAMSPQANEELYNDITFTSKDYRNKAVMEEKRVKEILGMPIKITKRIGQYDANTLQSAMYCQSGMHWGPAMPLTVKSQPNPAKEYREHPYIELWLAATRSEDKKVIKILSKK